MVDDAQPGSPPARVALASPCLLCAGTEGVRTGTGEIRAGTGEIRAGDGDSHVVCAICGWRVGDAPDGDLPPPRIDVVYYLRWRERIKIGTSHRPRQRLGAIWHEELLAFERGGRELEQQRHREFADLRLGGEWFSADERLLAHIEAIRGGIPPWHAYARWVTQAYR